MMDWTKRSNETEWMDDLNMDLPQLDRTLEDIAFLNAAFGGHSGVRSGMNQICKTLGLSLDQLRITDIGCGLGDCLNVLSASKAKLTGIDANMRTIQLAKEMFGSKGIQFINSEIGPEEISRVKADVVMFNLFFHHFSDEVIREYLKAIEVTEIKAVLINDLQRSRMSHFLYKIASYIFRLNPMAVNDGAISIRRGFRTKEWKSLLKGIGKNIEISSVWAFRHRIIIYN